jgi:gluconolactonase
MSKKMAQLFLLLSVLAATLAACSDASTKVPSVSDPTLTTSEPTKVAATPTTNTPLTAEACLNHTPGEAECKDCCDSLETDGTGRKTCRDTCPGHDFALNSDFITFEAPSVLGPNGDFAACTSLESEQACKACCDGSSDLQSGDRRFCRDTCVQSPREDYPVPAAELQRVAGDYLFAEGPATDQNGNVYFSDINAGKIYRWSPEGNVDIFLEGLNAPNGLAFDEDGNLIACEGGNGRLISIDPQGQVTVLADQYNNIRFNEPNDLWIDPQGGIYFTDPAYQSSVVQDGEYVYYLTPDRSQVMRVIDDLTRPNGIVGTLDGKTLYVADHGAGKTFAFTIQGDGLLADKRLFVSLGSDGMALDKAGNLYLTTSDAVQIFNAFGNPVQEIKIPEPPTNVTFGGKNRNLLFITARTAVYTLEMGVDGANSDISPEVSNDPKATSNMATLTLSSPYVIEAGALPVEYTCDGTGASLPLTWNGAPAGTRSFAIVMHHIADPDDIHWYWILYDIPVDVISLPKNSTGIGTLGNNSVNGKMEYAPPCSKGPGEKTYTYTIYALSTQPQFSVPASQINRDALLEAIQDITLGSAELNVTYTRP